MSFLQEKYPLFCISYVVASLLQHPLLLLATLGSFGLLAVGVSSLKKEEQAESHKVQKIESPSLLQSNFLPKEQQGSASYEARRATRPQRNFNAPPPSQRVARILHRNGSPTTPSKEKILDSLKETRLATLNERSQKVAEKQKEIEKQEPAKTPEAVAAQAPSPDKAPTLSEETGAKEQENTGLVSSGDYRKKILAQAKSEALKATEPWKELVAIALVQKDIQDLFGARETLQLASRLLPTTQSSARTSFAQAFAQIGDIELALDQAAMISEEKNRNIAYSSLISVQASRREFDHAKTLVSSLSLPDYKASALRTIAEAEASQGESTPALNTAQLISNLSLRHDALNRIASALARASQWENAFNTVNLISEKEAKQNALANVLRTRIDQGDMNAAQSGIWSLQKESLRNDLFSRMSNKYASQGQLAQGMQTAEFIVDKVLKEKTLANLSLQQARQGNTSAAFSQVRLLDTQSIQKEALKDVALVEASQRGIAAGCNMAALIENPDARDSAYRAIAEREAAEGNLSAAMNCVQNINSYECRVLSLADTALASIRKNKSHQAIKVLEDTTQMIPTLPYKNSKRSQALVKISHAFALINRIDEAMGNISHLPSENERNNAYYQIALDCVNNGQVENAQLLAKRILSPSLQKRCLETIALRYARQIDPKDGQKEIGRFDTNEQRAQFLRGLVR